MKITITIEMDENDLEIKEKETERVSVDMPSQFAVIFDRNNPNWRFEKYYNANLMFLRNTEHYANEVLKKQKILHLNDVYDMLGIPRSRTGDYVGWVYNENNPTGDNFVDFGLYDTRCCAFINGASDSVLLDFNVDGIIPKKTRGGS